MNEFDKIIGYASIKEELNQLCDIIHNTEIYNALGAKMPKGLLLYGEPGVGKSLMARTFLKASKRKSYVVRRNKPNGDFVHEIKDVFTEAAQNAPSIILLDDMDKFVGEDGRREEYIAVQACIDEVSFSDVYIIATANDLQYIPDSLLRAGRFDRKIHVEIPTGEDSANIIKHYIASKSVVHDLNMNDVAKMLHGKSCAELETLLNEAAIYAGYERCEKISMEHIVQSVLRNAYGASDSLCTVDSSRLERVACHEAGHVVISETLNANSIGIASLRTRGEGEKGGFVIRCSEWEDLSQQVLMLLAGMAAEELKYGAADDGRSSDLSRAIRAVTKRIVYFGAGGISTLNVFMRHEGPSNILRAKQEAIIQAEVERHLLMAKEILAKNREFLDAVAAALLEKNTLLNSDIQKLRESCAPIIGA